MTGPTPGTQILQKNKEIVNQINHLDYQIDYQLEKKNQKKFHHQSYPHFIHKLSTRQPNLTNSTPATHPFLTKIIKK